MPTINSTGLKNNDSLLYMPTIKSTGPSASIIFQNSAMDVVIIEFALNQFPCVADGSDPRLV